MTDTSHQWLEASQLRDPSARGLSSHVAELIRAGELSPGTTMPPVRRIAEIFRVSPATVSSAWNVLKKRGMLQGTGRSGVRVTGMTGSAMDRDFYSTIPGGNDLRLLYPDAQLLPPLDKALAAAAQLPHLNEYYGDAILPDLLEVVQPTWPYPAESFLVTNGASDALWTVLRSHTVPGDRIIIESPTQPQLLPLIEELGLTAVPVAYTAEGLDFDGFKEALNTRPAAVFFQPRAQVPTGLSTSQRNVDRIVELLRSLPYRPLIIEYDDLGDLARDAHRSIGMHLPEQVTLIRSYEKSYGPDLRLAVISSSGALMSLVYPHVRRTRQWTSRILQKALAWLCEDPDSQVLVHQAREIYGKRLDRFVEALSQRDIEVSNRDGLCVWVPVIDEVACITDLARQGVLILAGSDSFAGVPGQFVRIATSGLNDDQIEPLAHQVAAARVLFH